VQTGQFARARTDADDHLFRAKGQVVPPSQQSLPPLDGLECPCPLPKMIPNPVSARRSDGFTSEVLIDCEEDWVLRAVLIRMLRDAGAGGTAFLD